MSENDDIQALLNLQPYEQVLDLSDSSNPASQASTSIFSIAPASAPRGGRGPSRATSASVGLLHQFRVQDSGSNKKKPRHPPSTTRTREFRDGLRQFSLVRRPAAAVIVGQSSAKVSEKEEPSSVIYDSARIELEPDPFSSLPSFASPYIRQTDRTLFEFMSRYGHLHASKIWQESMLSDPAACLSFLNICVMAKFPGQLTDLSSVQPLAARFETIKLLNRQLQKKATQTSNSTMMSLNHMLVSELCRADRETILMHVRGSERVMILRGGFPLLDSLGPLERECAARNQYSILVACVMHEIEPCPEILSYTPSQLPRIWEFKGDGLMESPVHHDDDQPLIPEVAEGQPEQLLWILFGMRMMTDMMLEEIDRSEFNFAETSTPARTPSEEMRSVYEEVMSQPSCDTPDQEITGNIMYEAIRLVALIYGTSIMFGVPFSSASKMPALRAKEPMIMERIKVLFGLLVDSPAFEKFLGCALWALLVAAAAVGMPEFAAASCVDGLNGSLKPLPMKFFEVFYSANHIAVVRSMKKLSRIQTGLARLSKKNISPDHLEVASEILYTTSDESERDSNSVSTMSTPSPPAQH